MKIAPCPLALALAAMATLSCLIAPAVAEGPAPACTIEATLKAPKVARAGGLVTLKLRVKNWEPAPISGLNVQIGLPGDVCAQEGKGKVTPSLKGTGSPTPKNATVVNQRAYWLEVPIAARKSRTFTLKARINAYHPTETVSVSAFLYRLDATDIATCASTVPAKQVQSCLHES